MLSQLSDLTRRGAYANQKRFIRVEDLIEIKGTSPLSDSFVTDDERFRNECLI